ncbi:MAG: hypothetical protein KHZ87_04635 [Clostridiales bacterium]|nr:hypothetical protein [Clostridiales bacterium]MBS5877813.1 hypothetical protein [Clostridiales bacterium]MDU3489918.1 hypothetical protein [Clostridiales bacterium]
MKIKNKIMIPLMAGVLATGLLFAGCGNAANNTSKDELMEGAVKKAASATSVDLEMNVDVEGKIKAEGLELVMMMKGDMGVEANVKTQEAHLKGDYKIQAVGQEKEAKMELYQVADKGKMYTYSNVSSDSDNTGWLVSENAVSADKKISDAKIDINQVTEVYGKLKEYLADSTLQNKTENKEGRECYLVSGTIKGSDLVKLANESGNGDNSELESLKASGVDIDKLKVDVRCYFDKNSKDPYVIEFDMSKGLADALSGLDTEGLKGAKMEFPEFKAMIKFNSFDKTDSITVPDDVKTKAKKSSAKDKGIDNAIDTLNPLKIFS